VIKSLDDKASEYIDPVLRDLNSSASMVGMLGQRGGQVTVRHLIQMQSGIADFDVPTLDNRILTKNTCSPYEILQFVQSLKDEVCDADRSGECPCRFMCEPGQCTSYSSTNYVLAGLVLAGATSSTTSAASGVPLWQRFNTPVFSKTLGLDHNPALAGSKFTFPVAGKLRDSGLTVAGSSIQYGKTELWEQDSSVLGFTCGNCIASAHDAARFYYQLLGPNPSIVSQESLAMMKELHTLNKGWAAGGIEYGTGLMIQNVSPKQNYAWRKAGNHGPVPGNASASYIGHAGDTYAFQSDNGFFPQYNASISIVVNQDTEPPAVFITCQVLQVVARHFGDSEDFGCHTLPSSAKYECADSFGEKVCVESTSSHYANMSYKQCSESCKGPAPPPSPPSANNFKCAEIFGKKVCLPHGGTSSYSDCKAECH
jgi:CubicO group peptidase (beta-lactamase class C family)